MLAVTARSVAEARRNGLATDWMERYLREEFDGEDIMSQKGIYRVIQRVIDMINAKECSCEQRSLDSMERELSQLMHSWCTESSDAIVFWHGLGRPRRWGEYQGPWKLAAKYHTMMLAARWVNDVQYRRLIPRLRKKRDRYISKFGANNLD